MDALKVSLAKPDKIAEGVSVWEWSGSALDEGEEASQWFTNFVGKPCRLVRFDSGCSSYTYFISFDPIEKIVAMQVYEFAVTLQARRLDLWIQIMLQVTTQCSQICTRSCLYHRSVTMKRKKKRIILSFLN